MLVLYWWAPFFLILHVTGLYSCGVLRPTDPYVFIGHNLTMTCNITEPIPETSASLFFTKSDVTIPKTHIQILSSRSILLNKPMLSPQDEGNYVCKLKRAGSSKVIVIGNQFVTLEYEPQKVEWISCLVYNWENMTCSWELGINYLHPQNMNVTLVWTISSKGITNEQYDCPHQEKDSCSWKNKDGRNSFKAGKNYIVVVQVINKKTGNLTTSPYYTIYTAKIVQPDSVSNLQTSNNSTCINIRWTHNKLQWHGMAFKVQYMSKWENNKWQEVLVDNVSSTTICNLIPNTAYTVKVSCKPLLDGYWSEEQGTTVTLDQDVPGAAPEIQPGGFVEKPCMFDSCRSIKVYWRPIFHRLAHGKIINYRLTARGYGNISPIVDDTGGKTSGQLKLMTDRDYIIDVRGETEIGLSQHSASILILAIDKRPPYPRNFVLKGKENPHEPKSYILNIAWSEPETTQEILGYTLFWCNGTKEDFDCLEPLSWAVVVGKQKEFMINRTVSQIELLKNLQFGISMETKHITGETVSSGILWNECIIYDKKPLSIPKNVRALSLANENSILVEWDKLICSDVNKFHVYYCEATDGQNCTSRVVHVPSYQTRAKLSELSPEVTYRFWVQAFSVNGQGPESDAVYATIPVTGMSLTTEEIAWIVIGCGILVLMSLVGLIFVVRRCAVEVKETFKPYDIDMPNVPLPPIPMIRPDSSISKTPDSEDDPIYSKIPELPSPTPSDYIIQPDAPLISQTEKLYDRIGRMFKQQDGSGNSSGQGSTPSLFSRFNLGRNSMDSRGSHYQDNKYLGTVRPRPKRPCPTGSVDMISSDVSPYSCVDIVCPNSEKILRKQTFITTEKPCHSVGSMADDPDYMPNRPNNLSVVPDDSNYMLNRPNNLSAILDKNHMGTSSTDSGSREHFNIQLPLDRRKPDLYNDTITSCASNEVNSDSGQTRDSNSEQTHDFNSGHTNDSFFGQTNDSPFGQTNDSYCGQTLDSNNGQTHESSSEVTQDSNYLSEDKISSYVQEAEVCGISNPVLSPPQLIDGYVQETQLKCPNNNDIKIVNGYIHTQNIHEVLPDSNDVSNKREVTYRKALNMKPGPRPVSEVVQVPPHFYGSLSLLDSGDATEL